MGSAAVVAAGFSSGGRIGQAFAFKIGEQWLWLDWLSAA
jgi:hypothetical protein